MPQGLQEKVKQFAISYISLQNKFAPRKVTGKSDNQCLLGL